MQPHNLDKKLKLIRKEVYQHIKNKENNELFYKRLRVLCYFSFLDFIKFFYFFYNRSQFHTKPFHLELINALEDIAYCRNTKRNLMINMPVGMGKSLIVQYFIAWVFCRNKNVQVLYVSHNDDLVKNKTREIMEMLNTDFAYKLFRLKVRRADRSKKGFSFVGSQNGSGLIARSIGGGITGYDAGNPKVEGFKGLLVVDDPLDASDYNSVAAKKRLEDDFFGKLEGRRRHKTVPTILIMQRLALDDLAGIILKKKKENYNIIKIKALDDKTNESVWEDLITTKQLKELEADHPFFFYAQYQQTPIVIGSSLFVPDHFRFYTDLKVSVNAFYFMTSDTAYTVSQASDYTVICSWIAQDKKLYLIDMLRGKWQFDDMRRKIEEFYKINKMIQNMHTVRFLTLEDIATGKEVLQFLKPLGYKVKAVEREARQNKFARALKVMHYVSRGQVYVPNNKNGHALIDECCEFTQEDTHNHDDILDCMVDALVTAKPYLNMPIDNRIKR